MSKIDYNNETIIALHPYEKVKFYGQYKCNNVTTYTDGTVYIDTNRNTPAYFTVAESQVTAKYAYDYNTLTYTGDCIDTISMYIIDTSTSIQSPTQKVKLQLIPYKWEWEVEGVEYIYGWVPYENCLFTEILFSVVDKTVQARITNKDEYTIPCNNDCNVFDIYSNGLKLYLVSKSIHTIWYSWKNISDTDIAYTDNNNEPEVSIDIKCSNYISLPKTIVFRLSRTFSFETIIKEYNLSDNIITSITYEVTTSNNKANPEIYPGYLMYNESINYSYSRNGRIICNNNTYSVFKTSELCKVYINDNIISNIQSYVTYDRDSGKITGIINSKSLESYPLKTGTNTVKIDITRYGSNPIYFVDDKNVVTDALYCKGVKMNEKTITISQSSGGTTISQSSGGTRNSYVKLIENAATADSTGKFSCKIQFTNCSYNCTSANINSVYVRVQNTTGTMLVSMAPEISTFTFSAVTSLSSSPKESNIVTITGTHTDTNFYGKQFSIYPGTINVTLCDTEHTPITTWSV